MKVSFKIQITNNYLLYCSVINENDDQIQIHLPDQKEEGYTPCIIFNTNTIEICKLNENSIHFIQHWIENPDDYSSQQIVYQGKEYNVLPEVLFAIIILEFKTIVEKEYVIRETIVEIPSERGKCYVRIQTSLESIEMNEVEAYVTI